MTTSSRPRSAATAYEKLVNSLGGIVWEADPYTFQFSFVSAQAEAILGYPVEEWLSDPQFWRRHTHADDVAWCTAFQKPFAPDALARKVREVLDRTLVGG